MLTTIHDCIQHGRDYPLFTLSRVPILRTCTLYVSRDPRNFICFSSLMPRIIPLRLLFPPCYTSR